MSHNKPSRLRFAINLGNAVLAHLGETGKPAGITVELSHRLATRWGVSAEFVPYPAAGKVVADAGGEHWDIAFLAIDPAREATLRFTSPYITIHGTALVSVDSPCQSVADMDRPATTINVGQNAAYDLWLTRHLQHASLHRLPLRRRQSTPSSPVKGIWSPASASRSRRQPVSTPGCGYWRIILPRSSRPSASLGRTWTVFTR
ncbi:hypothetical protein KPZU09_11560 [Klebsiella pneumoniae]|uniref:Solute-binding protein family 3/N-terminal domain-containing protein n=1 Tax=Klebsiella pneumoniae TaxID=573 RepID=A0A919HPM7_KLEPN|nr:hypothetical protein KPZU09_11560 [Klebsiella pneumoniae]